MKQPNRRAAPTKRPAKRILGRRERVGLPALGLAAIEAKVDTGAYTSAIHCQDVHLTADPATGQPLLHVRLLDPEDPATDGRPLTFKEFTRRDIRSSNGEVQARYVIRTVVRLYGQEFAAEFSLADRSDMRHPVLLGRTLLRQGRFVVDVARRNVSYRAEQRAAEAALRPGLPTQGPLGA